MQATTSYRHILQNQLEYRLKKNPRYSLRAFAKDLNLAPSHLSLILNQKSSLSPERAIEVAIKLGLSSNEQELFYSLVELESGRSKRIRQKAQKKLQHINLQQNHFHSLQEDEFKVIEDWYHYGLLELIKLKTFKKCFHWMGSKLDLPSYLIEKAIARLARLGLIQENEEKYLLNQDQTTTCDIPSKSIREHQAQFIDKSKWALETQEVTEKDFSGLTLAFDPKLMPLVKDKIKTFRRSFNQELTNHPQNQSPTEVYQLNIQFFRLTKKDIQ